LGYQPHTKPFEHQQVTWEASRDLEAFCVFWEQGTGKTKLTIDTFNHLFVEGKIDAVVVVAPNGVHRNWITDELPTHMSPAIDYSAHAYKAESPMTVRQTGQLKDLLAYRGLAILAISYDAWMTDAGKKMVWKFMKKRRCMGVLDESHRVKTPTANRTKSILQGGKHFAYRRVLSGTPITNGPFDIYSQVMFTDPDFWLRELNIASFTAFKAHFGVWDKGWNQQLGREYPILVDYQNLDELAEAITRISSRVTKDDVLDLPPKLYTKRYYEMAPAQRRIYASLEQDFAAFLDGEDGLITAPLAITRMLRLQQVLCGYVPVDGDLEPTELIDRKVNPRLKLLREAVEDTNGKNIIWATWTRDIDLIMEALREDGRNPVRYDGTVSDDDRAAAKLAFQTGDATDFVANSQMSEGLTLISSNFTLYYNNSYKLLDRQQSEDRNHRIGQLKPVTYCDLICPGTRDERAIEALVRKAGVAQVILGDKVKEWL